MPRAWLARKPDAQTSFVQRVWSQINHSVRLRPSQLTALAPFASHIAQPRAGRPPACPPARLQRRTWRRAGPQRPPWLKRPVLFRESHNREETTRDHKQTKEKSQGQTHFLPPPPPPPVEMHMSSPRAPGPQAAAAFAVEGAPAAVAASEATPSLGKMHTNQWAYIHIYIYIYVYIYIC